MKKIKMKSIQLEEIRKVSLEKFRYQLMLPQEIQSGEISLFKFAYPFCSYSTYLILSITGCFSLPIDPLSSIGSASSHI